jgi:hypothetical protein
MERVLWWSLVLIGVILAAFVLVAQVKKRLIAPDEPATTGFTLSDLRSLHRKGQMTDEEFEKAKKALVGHLSRQLAAEDEPGAAPPESSADKT